MAQYEEGDNSSAQASLAATTLTDVYSNTRRNVTVYLKNIFVCNSTGGALTFRLSVAPAGAADDASQYLYYDKSVAANDTFSAEVNIPLSSSDVVRAYASNTGLSVNLFGTTKP